MSLVLNSTENNSKDLIQPATVIHNFEWKAKSVLWSSNGILISGYEPERNSAHFLINVQILALFSACVWNFLWGMFCSISIPFSLKYNVQLLAVDTLWLFFQGK